MQVGYVFLKFDRNLLKEFILKTFAICNEYSQTVIKYIAMLVLGDICIWARKPKLLPLKMYDHTMASRKQSTNAWSYGFIKLSSLTSQNGNVIFHHHKLDSIWLQIYFTLAE